MQRFIHIAILIFLIIIVLGSCRKHRDNNSARQEQDGTSNLDEDYSDLEAYPDEGMQQADSTDVSRNQTPVSRYNYSWTGKDDIPPVVIIIDDFGEVGGSLLDDFCTLPKEVVFAILPDLRNTKLAAQKAANSDREVIMHIPMEPDKLTTSPGVRYIKTGMQPAEINAMVGEFYAQMPMAVGANNHMGSKVTRDRAVMNSVLESLHEENLFFVDSFTHSKAIGFDLAREKNYLSAKRDIFLDVPDNSDVTLISKIESLSKFKGRSEPIVIITHCHNRKKLESLQKFIAQIKAMGVDLIPLSDAVRQYPG